VRQLIAHRRAREAQILQALGTGGCDVMQLMLRLYPDIAPGLQRAAAHQINAHLLHLAEKGAVMREGASWALRNGIP
jgi:hypothetical protein